MTEDGQRQTRPGGRARGRWCNGQIHHGRGVHGLRRFVSLAIAGVIVAGCGGGSVAPTVASLPGRSGSSGPRSTPLTVAQSDADMVEFARCMRAHGVQMSDPLHRPGHTGLSIDLPTQDAASASAYAACHQFIQKIVVAKQRAAAATAAPVLAALTTYAQCMRAHDIGMLDPTQEGQVNLGDVPGITGDFGRYSPQFRQADAACRHGLPASIHDDGTGP
jgi:hypothetical protein